MTLPPAPPPYRWTVATEGAILHRGPVPVATVERACGLYLLCYADGTPIRDGLTGARLASEIARLTGDAAFLPVEDRAQVAALGAALDG